MSSCMSTVVLLQPFQGCSKKDLLDNPQLHKWQGILKSICAMQKNNQLGSIWPSAGPVTRIKKVLKLGQL